jgi:DNA-directed RNA polymerase subunit RPC12/RpoP
MEENKKIKQTRFGWVDLSNLEYNRNSVDWERSIGRTVDFQYDDIVATLIITDRDDDVQYVYIDVPGYVTHYRIYVGQIRNGQFGKVIQRITPDFKYEIGDMVNDLLITEKHKIRGYKYYNYRCVKDGYMGVIREDHLYNGHGCPVCAGKVVLKGYNDIATTRPDMIDLFDDKNDAFLYREHSNKYTYFRCPRCGNKIYAQVSYVSYSGLSCKKCSDGISYPNKFVYNLIEQIAKLYEFRGEQLTFVPEKKFAWSLNFKHQNKNLSGNKIYDLYLCEPGIIIENHGDYHYKESLFTIKGARSFEEVNLCLNYKKSNYLILYKYYNFIKY